MKSTPTLEEFLQTICQPAIDLLDGGKREDVLPRIRAEFKLAQKHGVFPASCKFSIRKDGHNSFNIDLSAWGEGHVFSDEYTTLLIHKHTKTEAKCEYRDNDFDQGYAYKGHYVSRPGKLPRLNPLLVETLVAMQRIANRHNFDKSDIQTDYFHVGYYLECDLRTIEAAAERGIRLECDKEFSALVAKAHAAINSLNPSCRKKVCDSVFGRRGFEAAWEWSLNRIITIAEEAQGRMLAYDKRKYGWRVVTGGDHA